MSAHLEATGALGRDRKFLKRVFLHASRIDFDEGAPAVGCRLRLFSSKSDHLLTYDSNEGISEGICSVGGVDRGRLTPYITPQNAQNRALSPFR